MRIFFLKAALRSALASVGLTKTPIPDVFSSVNYQKPSLDVSALHIVVEPKLIVVHEYSSERRGSYYRQEHPFLESFLRNYVNGKIDNACTIYMATTRKDALEKLYAGAPEEFFKVRSEAEKTLKSRLDSFLSGWWFSLLEWGGGFKREVRHHE